jgi:cell wall-associated NlpC family hydrolase
VNSGDYDPARVKSIKSDSKIVNIAQKYLGTPYDWGGDNGGLDCSSFTHRVYKEAGINIPKQWFSERVDPRFGNEKACEKYGMKHTTNPVPGDVVIFADRHIGIYVGNQNGTPIYISANHGLAGDTVDNTSGRVDFMKVSSHSIKQPVYYHYTGNDGR